MKTILVVIWILLVGVAVPLNILQNIFVVKAQPMVYVSPATSTVDPPEGGKTFTVDIYVDYVEGVRAWEVKVSFDPSVILVETDIFGNPLPGRIVEGNFLTQGGASTDPVFFVTAGLVGASNMIKTVDWIDGEGVLMSITFTVIDTGKSALHLFDTEFVDVSFNPIVDQPVPVDGEFYTRSPHASFYYLPSTTAIPDYVIPSVLRRNPIVDEEVTFNASAFILGGRYKGSYDPDGTIVGYSWDFDDGSPFGTGMIVYHSYTEAKSYTVTLTVTDNEGRTQSYYEYVFVEKHDVAIIEIQVSPTVVSIGEEVSIKVNITNLGSAYEYANVTLYYRYALTDTLIWYSNLENKPAFSTAIERDPIMGMPPIIFAPGTSIVRDFTWNTAGLAEGDYAIWANVSLTDHSGMKFLRDIYLKELDNNMVNNELWDGIVTLTAGLHNIAVTDMQLSPIAALPATILYGTPEVTVNFTVSNTGDFDETFDVTLYRDSSFLCFWPEVFLEKKSSTVLQCTWNIEALAIGYYTLTAEASIVEGETRIEDNTLPLNVAITLPPVASFTYSPSKPIPWEVVTFDGSPSYAILGNIESYRWKFDSLQGPSRTYPTEYFDFWDPGIYTVNLTVTDSNGLKGSTEQLVRVYSLPTAAFTYLPPVPVVGEMVTFDASASYDLDGEIVSYEWDFGDSQTGTGKITTHVYTASISTIVLLTVTDQDDHTAETSKIITIGILPPPTTTVYVYPEMSSIAIDQTFTIEVRIDNVDDLIGWQFSLQWDTSLLDVVEATEGPFLNSNGAYPSDFLAKKPGDPGWTYSDTIYVADTLISPTHEMAATGSGTLAYVTFTAKAQGQSTLHFRQDAPLYSMLIGWSLWPPFPKIAHTTEDGYVTIKSPSSISISASPANVKMGQSTTISGAITPARAWVPVTIWYRPLGTEWWSTVSWVITDTEGRYSYVWYPYSLGTYELKASWEGDEEYQRAESEIIIVNVVLPQPVLTINPTSGPVGTKVEVHGTDFLPNYFVYLTFDDQLTSFLYSDSQGNFSASFNVPLSAPGPHKVKAWTTYYGPYSNIISAEAPFTVIDISTLEVSADVGEIFFKGETVEFYVQTTLKGTPVDATSISAKLRKPDGTFKTLTPQQIATGLYKISFTLTGRGSMEGTYTLVLEANYNTETISASGTAIETFLVKPTWEQETPKIAAYSIASIGLVSAMVLLWRKEKKKYL